MPKACVVSGHIPDWQVDPRAHWVPQVPQFTESLVVSTHAPAQLVSPAAQTGKGGALASGPAGQFAVQFIVPPASLASLAASAASPALASLAPASPAAASPASLSRARALRSGRRVDRAAVGQLARVGRGRILVALGDPPAATATDDGSGREEVSPTRARDYA